MQVSSLAGTLVSIAQRTSNKIFKAEVQPVVRALYGTGLQDESLPIPTLEYGEDLAQLVERTRLIPDAEILRALADTDVPFRRFWIEGPGYNSYNMLRAEQDWAADAGCRRGFYCQVAGPGTFLLESATELPVGKVEQMLGHKVVPDGQVGGRHIPGVELATISKDGIVLTRDDSRRRDNYRGMFGLNQAEAMTQASRIGAECHMSFFARAIVLLGALPNDGSIWREQSAEDLAMQREQYRVNMQRRRMNRTPVFSLRPVVIDPTAVFRPHAPAAPKTIRELLGKTLVPQSKPWRHRKGPKAGQDIITKDGRKIRTREHVRRIAKDEDRTQAVRVISPSRPADLDLAGDYPQLLIR